jgi:hypothetical protein
VVAGTTVPIRRKKKAPIVKAKKKKIASEVAAPTCVPTIYAQQCDVKAIVPKQTIPPPKWLQKMEVTKLTTNMTIKRGCQCYFVAKQVYVDTSLCKLQYHCWDYMTMNGKPTHGMSFDGF